MQPCCSNRISLRFISEMRSVGADRNDIVVQWWVLTIISNPIWYPRCNNETQATFFTKKSKLRKCSVLTWQSLECLSSHKQGVRSLTAAFQSTLAQGRNETGHNRDRLYGSFLLMFYCLMIAFEFIQRKQRKHRRNFWKVSEILLGRGKWKHWKE